MPEPPVATEGDRAPALQVVLCSPVGAAIPWRPPTPPTADEAPDLGDDFRQDLVYVGGILHHLTELVDEPLTVYVTRDVRAAPPTTGPDVVAIVLADEFERMPGWAGEVRAVFKRYGTRPSLVLDPWRSPTRLTALKLLQWGRKWRMQLPGRVQLLRARGRRSGSGPRVHVFPLGHFRQDERPLLPFDERPYDVLFYGSAVRAAPNGLRRFSGTVKGVGRATMLEQAERLQRARPDLRVELVITDSFAAQAQEAEPYTEALMRSKLCLSPAGNSPETYRNYEAWRYGCIPVTEALPRLWFHEGAPHLRVRQDWADLGAVVEHALGDPGTLHELHIGALEHWRDVCSEPAVARWMAERIRRWT